MKYLHVIYMAEESGGFIRSVDISRELGVTKASVSRMMKLLAEWGLISIKPQGNLGLTTEGMSEGQWVHLRMTGIYPFFADYLELDREEALDCAYSFIAGFSEHCVDRLLSKGWKENKNV